MHGPPTDFIMPFADNILNFVEAGTELGDFSSLTKPRLARAHDMPQMNFDCLVNVVAWSKIRSCLQSDLHQVLVCTVGKRCK